MPVTNYTPAPPPSVLVVDDYADARDVWSAVLGAEGFVVLTAATGPEALDTAVSSHPNLIVLDLGLPGLSGIDVARALRASEDMNSVPLVALTGCSDPDELKEAEAAGFNALFIKPCVPADLVAEIHRLLAA
jgi:CheY-like chemotaxis protein